MKGLDPAGGSWNTSSPSSILQDRVPSYVQDVFEQRLNGHGLGPHDLAVLAATLEHLVYNDAASRLEASYRALDLSTKGSSSEEQAAEAIDTFMMMFVLGQDIRSLDKTEIQAEHASILQVYPTWNETRDFVREVYRNVTGADRLEASSGALRTMDFAKAQNVIEAVQDQYGPWQDKECQGMKSALLKMEENNNGRVRLSDFYGNSIEGGWQFSESIGYLRQLGAMDESNPEKPRVIVANYMYGASNCLATTGFYSVCCINECENIAGQVERRLAAPAASAEEVAAIVAAIPSATVPAPRSLSKPLLRRLGEIAEHHDGQVPLHGRLFSQWLHHAFPRECPYPHAAGTTSPMTPEEWMAESGESATVTAEVAQEHAGARTSAEKEDEEVGAVPWSGVEELVHSVAPQPRSAGSLRAAVKGILFLVGFVAMALGVPRDALAAWGSKSKEASLLPTSTKYHRC
jgi:hypothetical protein